MWYAESSVITSGGIRFCMDEKIIADIKAGFGMAISNITTVNGGWLNQLWRASAGDRELLVKKYSRERFSREKLNRIESALQRQAMLEAYGVACPHVYRCGQKIIRFLDDGTAYMVMSFCQGKNENAQTINTAQMKSLGSACGYLHKAFSRLTGSVEKSFPAFGGYTKDSLCQTLRRQTRQLTCDMPAAYRRALLSCEAIVKQLPPDFFDRLPRGIAHEDFTPDNLLFHETGVEAVIDFDRNCYSYPWHDVGRAILSFALEDGQLNYEKIRAFVDGYALHMPLSLADVGDALRLSWCIEVPWWIQPDCFTPSLTGKAVDFREQILWLTTHWEELSFPANAV